MTGQPERRSVPTDELSVGTIIDLGTDHPTPVWVEVRHVDLDADGRIAVTYRMEDGVVRLASRPPDATNVVATDAEAEQWRQRRDEAATRRGQVQGLLLLAQLITDGLTPTTPLLISQHDPLSADALQQWADALDVPVESLDLATGQHVVRRSWPGLRLLLGRVDLAGDEDAPGGER